MLMDRDIFLNAIKENNINSIKEILSKDPQVINEKNDDDKWIMFDIIKDAGYETIRYLMTYADVDSYKKDISGSGLLHYAVKSKDIKRIKLLVEYYGYSPLEGNLYGITPMDFAAQYEYWDILRFFEQYTGIDYKEIYHNPVERGFFPDPSIVRVKDDYYMVNSSFFYYPCIPVSHSKDLIHWEIIGYAITKPEYTMIDNVEGGMGYWAPDISYHNGKFYITATLRRSGPVKRCQIIVSSERPEGPYSKPVIIDENGIDPSLFTDDDGKRYMVLNRGAKILEIDSDATHAISEAVTIWAGDIRRKSEGPHLLKKDGYYYLFLAEGGTGRGHSITVARSKNLYGPYENCPYNPILHQSDEQSLIQCCGHGKPIQLENGEWYMVYLCNRYVEGKYAFLGRETALEPIIWTEDNWPLVNHDRKPKSIHAKPIKEIFTDKTEDNMLWVTPRGKNDGITISGNCVEITGDGYDLNSLFCRGAYLRRQTGFNYDFECEIKVPELVDNTSAGITCYYDENSFIKFGVAYNDGSLGILLEEYVSDHDKTLKFEKKETLEPGQTITFKVKGRMATRQFCYMLDKNHDECVMDSVRAEYLCSEGLQKGKRFTGSMVGIYVSGSLKAEFKNIKYTNVDSQYEYIM